MFSRCLRPGPDSRADERRLLIAGLIIGVIFYAVVPVLKLSDTLSYVSIAKYFAGISGSDEFIKYSNRTPGYPLLLLLSGVTVFKSFLGIKLVQVVFAILIPVLVYRTGLYFNRSVAYYSGIASLFSLTSFAYANVINTETSYMFFLILSVSQALKYLRSGKGADLAGMTIAVMFMSMIRPGVVFLVFFVVLAAAPRRKLFHLLAAFGCIMSMFGAWSSVRADVTGLPFSFINHTNTSGSQKFLNIYLHRCEPFLESDGPATKKMIHVTKEYVLRSYNSEQMLKNEADEKFLSAEARVLYYERFGDDISLFADNIFINPVMPYWIIVIAAMRESLGVAESEAVFDEVFTERFRNYPGDVVKIVFLGFVKFFVPVSDAAKNIDYALLRKPEFGIPLTVRTIENINVIVSLLSVCAGVAFMILRPLIALLMVVGTICVVRTPKWPGGIMIFLIVMLHAAQVAVFSTSLTRYLFHTINLEIILAVIGAGVVGKWVVDNKEVFQSIVSGDGSGNQE